MFFSKKKREERKLLKEQKLAEKEEARKLAEKIKQEEEQLDQKEQVLKSEIEVVEESTGFLQRFKKGLAKTKHKLVGGLFDTINPEEVIDDDLLEEVEEKLISADLGYITTDKIIERINEKVDSGELKKAGELYQEVKDIIFNIMSKEDREFSQPESGPMVHLFVGVNGVGKTTTIGKLAAQYKKEGKKVLVAAGDTFRAAAIEQLVEWCKRAGVDYIAREINSDPAATMHEAATKAVNEGYDVLLCDTSGRLHTNKNLMDELDKIQRVIKKIIPDAPHASILVLDATTGQNAIMQVKEFNKLIGLNGLAVTKLDGTAKGGVVIGIVNEFDIPVYYVGVGEGIEDLQHFSAKLFAESLFE